MNTQFESVLVLYEKGKIVAVVHRDAATGHNIIFSLEAMDMEEIAELFKSKEK